MLKKPYSDKTINWIVGLLVTQILVGGAIGFLLPFMNLIFLDAAFAFACAALLLAKPFSQQLAYACLAAGMFLMGLGKIFPNGTLAFVGFIVFLSSCLGILLSLILFSPQDQRG